MPLYQVLLNDLRGFLKTSDLFSSFPLSLLLIILEALLDPHFSCPCKVHQNRKLTAFMFIGPALFTFFLMFLYVRPFRHGWFHCPDGVNDDTQKNWPKSLISCLIPPVMWIFLLLLDGDYFACGMTDWDGCYVFNKKMNMSWCHPYPEGNNMWCNTSSEDHGKMHRTLEYFHNSQFIGHCMIFVFSVLAVILVGIYDCFATGKCCCGRKLPDKVETVKEGESLTLTPGIKINNDDQIQWLFGDEKKTVIAEIKRGTGEITVSSDGRFRHRLEMNKKTGSLTITNTRPEDTGVYELRITGSRRVQNWCRRLVQNFKKRFIVSVRADNNSA